MRRRRARPQEHGLGAGGDVVRVVLAKREEDGPGLGRTAGTRSHQARSGDDPSARARRVRSATREAYPTAIEHFVPAGLECAC